MASTIVGNPILSGPQQIIIANPWSGGNPVPTGGIQFLWDRNATGNVYIGLSGNMTVNSGCMFLSGGPNSGLSDGMQVAPGIPYFIPKQAFPFSGTFNVYAVPDATASGNRLYFQTF